MDQSDEEKLAALATIIRESERLRDLAVAHGHDFLAFLLENVLHEAGVLRSEFAAQSGGSSADLVKANRANSPLSRET